MNRYFPYPTMRDPLTLVAEGQLVDGTAPPYNMLAARRSLDISGLHPSWRRVTTRLRLDLPGLSNYAEISDTKVTLSLNCPATNLRIGIPMIHGPRLGSYTADLEIEAGALAKKAVLRAVVSGTVVGSPHRYFGESDTWNIWVSPPEIPLLTGDLEVRWVAFNSDSCPQTIDPAFRSQSYYVDLTQDPPVVFLNESIADLRRLFDDAPRRSGTERAIREAHFHTIASSGWLAMFNASVAGIEYLSDGGVEWPDVEWQRQVLSTLLPKIYPDLSVDDAMKTACEDAASADGTRLLQSRAMAGISGLLQESNKLRSSIKALEESP